MASDSLSLFGDEDFIDDEILQKNVQKEIGGTVAQYLKGNISVQDVINRAKKGGSSPFIGGRQRGGSHGQRQKEINVKGFLDLYSQGRRKEAQKFVPDLLEATGQDASGVSPDVRSPSAQGRLNRMLRAGSAPEAGVTGKGSFKEGAKQLEAIANIRGGTGGRNLKAALRLQALGLGGNLVTTKFFNNPNSLASFYTRKGVMQSLDAVELTKKTIGPLEITVFTDRNTANLAQLIASGIRGEENRIKEKQKRERHKRQALSRQSRRK